MEIIVRGRHFDVPDSFREHAVERLESIPNHGQTITRIDVEVTKENNPRLSEQAMEVELTCIGRGPVIRAEYAAGDKFVAFDAAVDRLVERLRRSGEKRRTLQRSGVRSSAPVSVPLIAEAEEVESTGEVAEAETPDGIIFAEGPVLVREKTHVASPMTVEQALEEMELVGHDFFLFLDSESDKPSVVYRRRGYDYGLIRLSAPDGVQP